MSDRQTDRPAHQGTPGGSRDPMIGRLLEGRYRIGDKIARGGMATVYEATDTRLDRTVAVKVMHAGLGDDEEFAARFVREARAAAKLSHPNIVAVYDQGNDDGSVFLAMEMVPGHTLRDTITKESPMTPARALALLEPVISALAAAHRAGLMHRDVKPENVLIADDGRVKVADFGLAKAVSADTTHTATGVLIGTVSYIAPELVVEGRADARADVYAVGVILSELLTGQKPHQGETPIQVAYKHVHEDVPPPSRLAPGLPAYVDALVARATARDTGQRPADAGVLLRHVHRVQHALAAGVREDVELTQDLTPRPPSSDAGVAPPRAREGDTAAEPYDADEMALLLAPSATPLVGAGPEVTATLTGHAPPAQPIDVRPAPTPAPTPRPPRRRRRRGPLLLVMALLVAAAVGAGAWWLGWARYSSMPSVLDLTQAAATKKLEAAGLDVELGTPVYDDDVAAGRVVSTDPGPGSRVLDGSTVTLVVSLGVEEYALPPLKGLTEQQARDALEEVKLEVGLVRERYSEKVPEGQVIRSDPKSGQMLRPGASVDLVLSQGRRPIKVGDWVGKEADTAQAALEKRGLVVDRTQEVFDDEVPAGIVISQNPPSGTLFRGETVTLTVSKGPELVEVPGVRAQGVDSATATLQAAGFVVDVQQASGYLGLGYVFSQTPDGGQLAPRGSTVTIYLI